MTQSRSGGAAPRPVVLVRPARLDPTGTCGPTRGQARGRRWRRVGPGLYVPATVSDDLPEQRIVEAAVRLPQEGAVTGWAAGRLLGAGYLDGLRPDGVTRFPVPLATGARARLRQAPGVQLLRNALPEAEVTTALGIPCTIPERAALDAVRSTPALVECVVVLDMLMLGEVTSPERLHQYAADRAGLPGVTGLLSALDLADENSWSPNETRTRMVWVVDAGLPRPLVNKPNFDRRGRLLGYPDLLDEEAGLVCEFDGAEHRQAGATAPTWTARRPFADTCWRSPVSPDRTWLCRVGCGRDCSRRGHEPDGSQRPSDPGPRRSRPAGPPYRRWRSASSNGS